MSRRGTWVTTGESSLSYCRGGGHGDHQDGHCQPHTILYYTTPSVSKMKVMFGHKLRYEMRVTLGGIPLKLRQTNWNVARNNVYVVVDELPSQIIIYTCLTIDVWTRRRRHTSTRFYVWDQSMSIVNGDERACCLQPLARWKELSESYATHAISC